VILINKYINNLCNNLIYVILLSTVNQKRLSRAYIGDKDKATSSVSETSRIPLIVGA